MVLTSQILDIFMSCHVIMGVVEWHHINFTSVYHQQVLWYKMTNARHKEFWLYGQNFPYQQPQKIGQRALNIIGFTRLYNCSVQ